MENKKKKIKTRKRHDLNNGKGCDIDYDNHACFTSPIVLYDVGCGGIYNIAIVKSVV